MAQITETNKKKNRAYTKTPVAANASGYVPLNRNNYTGEGYDAQVQEQLKYIIDNPTAVKKHTAEEYNTLFGHLEGTEGVEHRDRVTPEGSSGADEGILSKDDYAAVQYLKEVWAESDAQYKKALEEGNEEEARRWLAQRDDAHLQAERVRAASGYSGGSDGSMYIDYKMEGMSGKLPAVNETVERFLDGKGVDYETLDEFLERKRRENQQQDDSWYEGSVKPDDREDNEDGWYEDGTKNDDGEDDWEPERFKPQDLPEDVDVTLETRPEDYSGYLQEMYAAQTQAELARLEEAYRKNVDALNRAEAGMDGAYRAARNQSAADHALAARNFHEYAAAAGLNSGTGGQAQLARSVTLQNDLSAINARQADAVADLQLQRASAETEYNSAIAQAQSQGDYELAAALYEEKIRVEQELMEQEIQQRKLQLEKYQRESENVKDANELGFQMLKHENELGLEQKMQNDELNFQRDKLARELGLEQQMHAEELAFQKQKHNDELALEQWRYSNQFDLQQQENSADRSESREKQLAQYGRDFLKQGIMPTGEMLVAMGITADDAREYIAGLNKM